jgi:hypothetical protein
MTFPRSSPPEHNQTATNHPRSQRTTDRNQLTQHAPDEILAAQGLTSNPATSGFVGVVPRARSIAVPRPPHRPLLATTVDAANLTARGF